MSMVKPGPGKVPEELTGGLMVKPSKNIINPSGLAKLLEEFQVIFRLAPAAPREYHAGQFDYLFEINHELVVPGHYTYGEIHPIWGHAYLDNWRDGELSLVGVAPIGALATHEFWKDFERHARLDGRTAPLTGSMALLVGQSLDDIILDAPDRSSVPTQPGLSTFII